jgi:hypothetical protein
MVEPPESARFAFWPRRKKRKVRRRLRERPARATPLFGR